MGPASHYQRVTLRLRRWAQLAADRATDPGSDTELWQDYAARLERAADLFDAGQHSQAVAIRDAVIGDLIGTIEPPHSAYRARRARGGDR